MGVDLELKLDDVLGRRRSLYQSMNLQTFESSA